MTGYTTDTAAIYLRKLTLKPWSPPSTEGGVGDWVSFHVPVNIVPTPTLDPTCYNYSSATRSTKTVLKVSCD